MASAYPASLFGGASSSMYQPQGQQMFGGYGQPASSPWGNSASMFGGGSSMQANPFGGSSYGGFGVTGYPSGQSPFGGSYGNMFGGGMSGMPAMGYPGSQQGFGSYGFPSMGGYSSPSGYPVTQNYYFGSGADPFSASAATTGSPDLSAPAASDDKKSSTNQNNQTTFNPWAPQGAHLKVAMDEARELYDLQEKQGAIKPSADTMEALRRLATISQGSNPLAAQAVDAVSDVTTGKDKIGSNFYDSLWNSQGITADDQMARLLGVNGDGTEGDFRRLAGQGIAAGDQLSNIAQRDAVNSGIDYLRMANGTSINLDPYRQLLGQQAASEDPFRALYGGQGDITNKNQYQSLFNSGTDPTVLAQIARGAQAPKEEYLYNLMGDSGPDQSLLRNMYANPGISTQPTQGLLNATVDAERLSNVYQQMGQPNVGGQVLRDVTHQADQPGSLSQGMFGNMAQGNLVGNNPYREQAIQDSVDQAMDAVKASMSAAGRYGSGKYADAAARAAAQVATQARMQGFDTDTANMMSAAQARSGENLGLLGQRAQAGAELGGLTNTLNNSQLNAAQAIANTQGSNIDRRLGAAGQLANIEGQNAGTKLSAAQSLGNLQGQGFDQQLAARQAFANLQNQDVQNRISAAGGQSSAETALMNARLNAAQGLTSAQEQDRQARLGAAQGLADVQQGNWNSGLQGAEGLTNAQNLAAQIRLAGLGGYTGTQEFNSQAQRDALTAAGGFQNQEMQNALAAMGLVQGGQQFNRQNQLDLLSAMGGLQNQDFQNRMGIAAGQADLQGQNLASRLAGASQAEQARALQYYDAQQQAQVGAMRDALNQQQRNYGWDLINNYKGVVGNVPGTAGSQSTPEQPLWQQLLGGGLFGLGSLGGLFG